MAAVRETARKLESDFANLGDPNRDDSLDRGKEIDRDKEMDRGTGYNYGRKWTYLGQGKSLSHPLSLCRHAVTVDCSTAYNLFRNSKSNMSFN